MEPASALLTVLAKAVLAQAGKELGGTAARQARTRVFGDPERRALERALGRAFAVAEAAHGGRLAEFDVNPGLLAHEGAAELARAIVPGAEPSATRLAERAVDSLGRQPSDDVRWDRITRLRPVFKSLLDALAAEVRREPALNAALGRADDAAAAAAAARLVTHLGAAPATEDDLAHYLRWLIDQHRYVRTAGVVRKTTVQLPLDEVFVGLRALPDRHPGDRARAWFEREREKLSLLLTSGQLDHAGFEAALDRLHQQYGRKFSAAGDGPSDQLLPVLDAVRDTAHLLVLGDPGTGKTTLLRYLALTHARALATGGTVDGQPPRFPLYVRISVYARKGAPDVGISEFLPGYLRGLECRTPGLDDLLHRRLDEGRCLVLLDGLDEIGSAEQRREVVAAVANFVTAHARQGNRFVVTSRISGYLAAPLPEPFRAVRLQDMDDATVRRFLGVYCREVERAETPGRSPAAVRAAGEAEAASIGLALTGNAGVRRLAANPLLLTALVLVHRASGRLPHRRIEAYVEVCSALGRTWRSVQGVAEAELPDERILTRWLTELGAWIHEHRPEGAVTRPELLRVLGPLWAAHHGRPWDPDLLHSADPLGSDVGLGVMDFVDKADRHTGLLVERAPGRYGFAHLTFEEYYTGRALAFRGAASDRVAAIRGRLHDPRYDEPILLALGLIGTDYAEQVETVVAEAIHPAASPSPYEELLGRDFLFMLHVLADDIPVETATIDAVVNRAIDELITPEAGRCRFTAYRTGLYHHLADLGATKAAGRLLHALGERAAAAVRQAPEEFCRLAATAAGLGPLPVPAVAALVEAAVTAEPPGARIEALRALAAAGLPQPAVAPAAELAATALEPAVRLAAMRALADRGELARLPVPVLVDLVTDLAMDPWLPGEVIRIVVDGGGLTEPVIAALAELATGPGDEERRLQAASALAAGGALGAPVIAALAELATTADDPALRRAAGGLVSETADRTDAVAAALTRLATGASDPEVRAQAVRALAAGDRSGPAAALIEELAVTAEPVVRLEAIRAAGAADAPDLAAIEDLAVVATDDPWVRLEAVRMLAAEGALTEQAAAAAVELATTAEDPGLRTQVVSALSPGGAPTEPALAALQFLAGAAEDPAVQLAAIGALAEAGQHVESATDAAVELATTDDDPDIRAQAVIALARPAVLSPRVLAVLVELAGTDGYTEVAAEAVSALAAHDALSQPAIAAAVRLTMTAMDWQSRLAAVIALRQARPTTAVRRALLSRFADADNDVRKEAGLTLVGLSREHPGSAAGIRADLARACTDPALGEPDIVERRPGWDYAYDALRAHLEAHDEMR